MCDFAPMLYPGKGIGCLTITMTRRILMPSADIASPTTVAPVDRLHLAIASVRQISTGYVPAVTPSFGGPWAFIMHCKCFEGNGS